jgi:hypothetical protein
MCSRNLSLPFAVMVIGIAYGIHSAYCQEDIGDYIARFERMDKQINNGRGFSDALNNKGALAWGESYILQSYVEMYRATDDTAYLDRLVQHFERVLAKRDDVRRVIDYYRKVPLAGWGSDEFSQGRWHVWAVHTGMICQGPMDFVVLVNKRHRLRALYGRKADEFLARIKECVAAHDPEWRNGPGPHEGYYHDPGIGPLPLNQQNALGQVMIGLYQMTKNRTYKDRVRRLANYFKNRLRITPEGAYDWSYWPKPDAPGSGSEDLSHASINIQFAVRCREAHIVFNNKDMAAFAKTWLLQVKRAEGEWADTVSGGGGTNTYIPEAAGCWLDLSPFNRRIFHDIKRAFSMVGEDRVNCLLMLGLAKLARWQEQLKPRPRERILLSDGAR